MSLNTILAIVIIVVLIGGGVFLWKEFGGTMPSGDMTQTPSGGELVPVSWRGTSPSGTQATSTPEKKYTQTIDIESRGFFFVPDTFRVKLGEKVTVNVRSFGDHTFTIDAFNVNADTPDGKVTKVEFTPTQAGAFPFYCSKPGHEEAGQAGMLLVE